MSVSFENTATNRGVVTFTIGQDKNSTSFGSSV